MFDVSKINKTQDSKTSKAKSSTNGANFSEYLNQVNKPQAQNVSGTGSISLGNAIFAAQTIDTEEEQRRKQQIIKRGHNLIEKLEDIRSSILLNDFSKEKLIEISRYVKQVHDNTADEKLNEIIAEIELRVEVELAKLENLVISV